MSSAYANFTREPSSPHQCMHSSEKDGTRCRATAMHNQYMCYHHRSDDIPTVIENDPFEIASLADHDAIQQALTDVAARLACNRIDFKRAALLLQSLQIATSNLNGRERQAAQAAKDNATVPTPGTQPPTPNQQPAAGNQQPATSTEQPAANTQQPATLRTLTASASPLAPTSGPAAAFALATPSPYNRQNPCRPNRRIWTSAERQQAPGCT